MKGTTFIVPSMRFTCNGTITRWIIAGEIVEAEINNGRAKDRYPKLQIWRLQSSSGYYTTAEISLECDRGRMTFANNIHECLLSSGVDVQPNDVLGLYLAEVEHITSFSVYFDSNSSNPHTTVYYISGMQTELSIDNIGVSQLGLPLIALQVNGTR